jgi:hypothetical protein
MPQDYKITAKHRRCSLSCSGPANDPGVVMKDAELSAHLAELESSRQLLS